MFGLGFGEIAAILIVAIMVFGPDRLPELAKQAAGFLKTFRKMAQDAKTELRKEMGDDFKDLGLNELRSLDPRQVVRDALRDDPAPVVAPVNEPRAANTYLPPGATAPFDEEST